MGEDRVVVVTGASAGVGRAVALAYGRRGARLGLLARDAQALEQVRAEVRRLGGDALACPVDMADSGAVENAADAVERHFGGNLDIWVNCAMVTVFAPFDRISAEEFRRVTEVTYLGYVHGTQAALKRMKPRNWGSIVQVGSALAYRSIPLQSAYCGAKAAIRGFTDSLRSELIHDDSAIRLTMVHLPAVNTPQFDWARARMPGQPRPVAPVYQPEPVAEAIVWAAGCNRREIHLGAMTALAIQANKVAPGLLDRYLARTNYQAQQRPSPLPPARRDNLFTTVPGAYGTHGAFDGEARASIPQFALVRHRLTLLAALGAASGLGLVLTALRGRRREHRRALPVPGR